MRLVLVSDLHGYLPPIPECDVLVIAGDICPVNDHTLTHQRLWLNSNFKRWLYSQRAKNVVATAGNHDWIFQKRPDLVPKLPWKILIDESCEIDGVRFHGCPWQPEFCDWAFNAKPAHLKDIHGAIPECDVLISHGPPFAHCDTAHRGGEYLGAKTLNAAIVRTLPKLVVCGHIHGGYGQSTIGGTAIVNVSLMNESYKPVNAPVEWIL